MTNDIKHRIGERIADEVEKVASGRQSNCEQAAEDILAMVLQSASRRAEVAEGALREANSLARRAILGLARVRGMLEESTTRAAILRTESVYVPAPMAREFIALAKALQDEDEARSALRAVGGGEASRSPLPAEGEDGSEQRDPNPEEKG
jgi:hypothetical protein